jgi:hypothetical protein
MGQQILTPKARPRAYSAYNIELGAQVCEAIGNGMLLDEIAKLPGMPSAATIYSWIRKHAEFAVMYEAALMARFDLSCEELLSIAKGEKTEVVTKTEATNGKVNTKTVYETEPVERSKVRIDALKWIMTKRLPRIYGEPSRMPRRPRRYTSAKRVTVRWIDAAQRR